MMRKVNKNHPDDKLRSQLNELKRRARQSREGEVRDSPGSDHLKNICKCLRNQLSRDKSAASSVPKICQIAGENDQSPSSPSFLAVASTTATAATAASCSVVGARVLADGGEGEVFRRQLRQDRYARS